MNELFYQNIYFGVTLSLIAYTIGYYLKKKFKYAIFNPLLMATIICITFLVLFQIDFETYNYGAQYITFFMMPATVCLAVPLYKQFEALKKNLPAILTGIFCGCIAHAGIIVGMLYVFKLDQNVALSLLSKSVTTPIALGICEELGGIEGITLIGLTVAGLLGAIAGPAILKLFRIKEPVAQGLAVGSASHAIGTSKMIEIGEVQAAMSSLAIVVTGLLTVVIAPIIANLFLK